MPARSVEGLVSASCGHAVATRQQSSAMVGHALVHGRHEVILTNTRRATVKVMWGAGLGHFQAKSDIGPKMKFEACELILIFHLETVVIRALH